MLDTPLPGDVVVRIDQTDERDYIVVESDTGRVLDGPFQHEAAAIGVAESIATKRSGRAWVLREGELVRLP